MSKVSISQKQTNSNLLASPIEEMSERTSLNIKKSIQEGMTRIGASKHLTFTAMANEAFQDYCAKMNNTQRIDTMIRETNGFWIERDLSQVVKSLHIETAKAMIPYQIAYLYHRLRDSKDRERVLTALTLTDELQQISALNEAIQKSSNFDGEKLQNCNIYKLAIELKANLTQLQAEYLCLVFGKDTIDLLKARRPEIFPILDLPPEAETTDEAADELETDEVIT